MITYRVNKYCNEQETNDNYEYKTLLIEFLNHKIDTTY